MCPTFELPDMDVTGSVFEGGEEAGYTHSSVGTKQILKDISLCMNNYFSIFYNRIKLYLF